MAVNDRLLDRSVAHAVGLQRLSAATVRRIIGLLNRVDADLENQIRRVLSEIESDGFTIDDTRRRRLEQLLRDVRELNAAAYLQVGERLRGDLFDLAGYEGEFQTRLIGSTLPIEWNLRLPNAEQLASIVNSQPFRGRILRDWVSELDTSRARAISDAVKIGMTEGETTEQIVRRIRGTRAQGYRNGILEIHRRHAEAVVRTATNHVASRAREATYAANADIISGVVWVSTLDSRTSPICRERDGKIYPVDSGPRPPAHWNCRSATAPITKSWRELGFDAEDLAPSTRASMNGQVPEDMTYGEWLRRQDRETVEEVLGVKKARLFLKGELPIERFNDPRGKEYTLEELRSREAAAFERAGF